MDSNPELTLRAHAVYSETRTFQYRVQRHIRRDLQTHFKIFFFNIEFSSLKGKGDFKIRHKHKSQSSERSSYK